MKRFFLLLLLATGSFFASAQINLSDIEQKGILYMREEEKLARDVYEIMFTKWERNPFGNIRFSEQNHMDRIEMLINSYKLNDPIKNVKDQRGKFVSPIFQKLYDELVSAGSKSFTEALKAGAKIEEIDIADLKKELGKTNKHDIVTVYNALLWASENHLNAFTGMLKSQGIAYKPSVLSQQDLDTIIANDHRGKGAGRQNDGFAGKGRGGSCGACQKNCNE